MKKAILAQLCQPDSKCRVVFATMAMGMGVDIPCLREEIHIDPPQSIESITRRPVEHGEMDNSPGSLSIIITRI